MRLINVELTRRWWPACRAAWRRGAGRRGLCFTLAVTVTLSTVPVPPPAWATTPDGSRQQAAGSKTPATPSSAPTPSLDLTHLDVSSLVIPETLGHVVEAWQPPHSELSTLNAPAKLVIHLQDLHTHAEAQQNLSDLISYLHDKLGISLVALEGAEGLCDTTLYSDLPDPPSTERIAKLFLQEGLFTGAEYYGITHPGHVTLWGVEDQALYLQHLDAYRQGEAVRVNLARTRAQLRPALEHTKRRLYPKALRELAAANAAYEQGKLTSKSYILRLLALAKAQHLNLAEYPALTQVQQWYAYHAATDLAEVEREHQALVEEIIPRFTPDDRVKLFTLVDQLTHETIAPLRYYQTLKQLAEAAGISLAPSVPHAPAAWLTVFFIPTANATNGTPPATAYPHLARYIQLLTWSTESSSKMLSQELDRLYEQLAQRLAGREDAGHLLALEKRLAILQGLVNVRLSPDEWAYYQQHRAAFTPAQLNAACQMLHLPSALPAHADLAPLESFYTLAHQRDHAFVENAAHLITQSPTELSRSESLNHPISQSLILITGGFHTPGITQQLKERHIAYVVIAPEAKGEMDESRYRTRLTDTLPSFEDLRTRLNSQTLIPPDLTSSQSALHRPAFRLFMDLKASIGKRMDWLRAWVRKNPEKALRYGVVAIAAGKVLWQLATTGQVAFGSDDSALLASAMGGIKKAGREKEENEKGRTPAAEPLGTTIGKKWDYVKQPQEHERLLMVLTAKDPQTARILRERLELMDPSDEDALKYWEADLRWFLSHEQRQGYYYTPHEAPKISVVILHYGQSPEATLHLLQNLAQQTYEPFDIILVDNNSPDGFSNHFAAYAETLPSRIRERSTLITNQVNLGYTGGNNQAARLALKQGSEYVFFINNDGLLERDGLAQMVAAVKDRLEVGALQPALLLYEDSDIAAIQQLVATGEMPASLKARAQKMEQVFVTNLIQASVDRPVPYLQPMSGTMNLYYKEPTMLGTAQLVRSDMLRLSGGFDTRLFMFVDEDDIGYRYHMTGLKKATQTDVYLLHPVFESPRNIRSQYLIWRNHVFVAEQYYHRGQVGHMIATADNPYQFAAAQGRAWDTLTQRLSAASTATERTLMFLAIYKGIADGLLGRFAPTREQDPTMERSLIQRYGHELAALPSARGMFMRLFTTADPTESRRMIYGLQQAQVQFHFADALDARLERQLLQILKEHVTQWRAWVMSSARDAAQLQRLRESFVRSVMNAVNPPAPEIPLATAPPTPKQPAGGSGVPKLLLLPLLGLLYVFGEGFMTDVWASAGQSISGSGAEQLLTLGLLGMVSFLGVHWTRRPATNDALDHWDRTIRTLRTLATGS